MGDTGLKMVVPSSGLYPTRDLSIVIYQKFRDQIVVEIVIVINTSIKTQSSKNIYGQTSWLV